MIARRSVFLVTLAAILSAGALLVHPPAAARAAVPINNLCPVMTEEEVDPDVTVDFQGRTVAFCCDRCRAKFLNDPARYAHRLPQVAAIGSFDALGSPGGTDGAALPPGRSEDPASSNIAADVPWLGRIHPALVHFPLAGIPLALLGFLAWSATGREAFARADVVPLFMGSLASVAAVITGNIAEDAMHFSGSLHEIAERHELASTTVMIICLCLSGVRVWRWNRMSNLWHWVYCGGLVIASALLGVTGFLGASLVFGPDHLKF